MIPSSKNDTKKKDDVSLRATFGSICGVPPLSTWTQKMMIDGIERQEDSESKGGDYHYTRLTDEDLSRKVGKRCAKRLAMVRKAWQHDNRHDYTKPSQVRNVTAVSFQQSFTICYWHLDMNISHLPNSLLSLYRSSLTLLPLPPPPSVEVLDALVLMFSEVVTEFALSPQRQEICKTETE